MTLKTVDIKGKPYVTVNERLRYFRENHPGYSLESEVIEITEEFAIIRAVIRDQQNNGAIIATGIAREVRTDTASFVNKTSYVENCETSAWGRALANFGIGIDANVASADEIVLAIQAQDKPKPKLREDSDKAHTGEVMEIDKLCKETGTDMTQLYDFFNVDTVPTKKQAPVIIASLKKKLSSQLDSASAA